jgi:hypothetical protein
MLAAPNLESIAERLKWHPHAEWGPDGVRYVCILFWNDHGYRILRNTYSAKDWERWDMSSGEFWDLFLAGCYIYGRPDHYGNTALALAEGRTPFYWSKQKSDLLAETFSRNSVGTTADRPWSFTGPLELVVVGARRYGEEVEFEWPGLRAIQLSDKPLGQVVADYTEAHVQNDAGLLSPGLPAPGDFQDDVTFRQIFFGVAHLMPFVGKAFHAYRIVRAID